MSKEARKNLLVYKYSGGDNGFVYKVFYNPVATKLVKLLPDTLAPNVITTIGFLFSSIPFVLMVSLYGTHFYNSEPIPSWLFYL